MSTAEVIRPAGDRHSQPKRSCAPPTRRRSRRSGWSTCCSSTWSRSSTSGCGAPAWRRAPRTSATRRRCGWRSRRSARCCRCSSRRRPEQVGPIRDALSQLQLAFVRIGGQAAAPPGSAGAQPGEARRLADPGRPSAGRDAAQGRPEPEPSPGTTDDAGPAATQWATRGCPASSARPGERLRRSHARLPRRSLFPGPPLDSTGGGPFAVVGCAPARAAPELRASRRTFLSSFLTHHGVLVALVCAAAAILYGALTSRALLALSPGNDRMRAISAAVQEGASAYLNRQYTTIAGVGVVLFIALIPIQNIRVAIGFAIGGLFSAAAGYIGMNVSVRANARVAEAARGGVGARPRRGVPRRCGHGPAGRRPRPDRRRRLLRRADLDRRREPAPRGRRADRTRASAAR